VLSKHFLKHFFIFIYFYSARKKITFLAVFSPFWLAKNFRRVCLTLCSLAQTIEEKRHKSRIVVVIFLGFFFEISIVRALLVVLNLELTSQKCQGTFFPLIPKFRGGDLHNFLNLKFTCDNSNCHVRTKQQLLRYQKLARPLFFIKNKNENNLKDKKFLPFRTL
jgi:hypothetical protein